MLDPIAFVIITLMGTLKSISGSEKNAKAANVSPIPLPVERALLKLGSDISLARRRRRLSQESLAVRIGASLSTVRRMEKGSASTPLVFLARTLHVFSELPRFESLLDTAKDDIGLTLMDKDLPQRIRTRKKPTSGAL
ncbi:helix-turn-helix domain-containing protein [Variovorax robiniae]|uniref:Helix-turn-helix domain-containing protein n=1 Tax=Variovorax robiniae TaxID=1836199 RepID=A0ABU8X907_9BURK